MYLELPKHRILHNLWLPVIITFCKNKHYKLLSLKKRGNYGTFCVQNIRQVQLVTMESADK